MLQQEETHYVDTQTLNRMRHSKQIGTIARAEKGASVN